MAAEAPKLSHNNGTPVLMKAGGKPVLVVNASNALQGLDPATGEPLWWVDVKAGFGASVAFGEGVVYADSGQDGGSPAVCVDPNGTGNVAASHVKWKLDKVPAAYGSPVIAGGYVYRAHKPNVVECRSLATGEAAYSEPLEGVSFLTSPFATPDGRVYFVGGGKSYVLRAGPKFEVLGTGTLDGGDRGSSPAVANGKIYVTSGASLYCLGKK